MTIKKISVLVLTIVLSIFSCFFAVPTYAQEIDSYIQDNLIASIKGVASPKIFDDYIVFTADAKSRYTGIAFDFENFRTIHTFQQLDRYDTDNEISSSVFFYILQIPKGVSSIGYRLIIDGLWTVDPLNSVQRYDITTNSILSYVSWNTVEEKKTENKKTDGIHFVYKGEPNQEIRLAGNFTNWDSFIYYLNETRPGIYELNIKLPKGTYYYAFFNGMSQINDKGNPNQVYTQDGRIASVINVN